ncbi:MAG TPA: alpha/beta hydrolase family protein [Vicinamibacterales bacterium]|jgi:dienelactone hydrolase
MLGPLFHAWERRLASVSTDRTVRPFAWGLEWIPSNGHPPDADPASVLRDWVHQIRRDTDRFFTAAPTTEYAFTADPDDRRDDPVGWLTFPSAFTTPHPQNNTVYARYFPARRQARDEVRRAVLVLPQWNADEGGHVGLARLLARAGVGALRLSLPYHDRRMPTELQRADFIVSANVARTVQVCRQAVLDARRAIDWLAARGYERIGILGTSLGSCLALLTSAHDPRITVQALNHVSPFFADVVWHGISTRHIRTSLDGRIDLRLLRRLWQPINPYGYIPRIRRKKTLLVYAKYDLTFPVDLSRAIVRKFERLEAPHEVAVLPCGHYSTGKMPFSLMDGWALVRFFQKNL